MSCEQHLQINLPLDYNWDFLLAYQGRFEAKVAELLEGPTVYKGVCWAGSPGLLRLEYFKREKSAWCKAYYCGQALKPGLLEQRVQLILGLSQSIDAFVAKYRNHSQLGQLISARPGLRPCGCGSPFEALTWAIVGQQVNLAVAKSMRSKLIRACGVRLPDDSPLEFAFPEREQLGQLGLSQLRSQSLSQAKAQAILSVCQAEIDWHSSPQELEARLLSIKGIGPWTVSYTLLRGLGWWDGSLALDAAFRNRLARLLNLGRDSKTDHEKLSAQTAQDWLNQFRPWRALAAAHVWAS